MPARRHTMRVETNIPIPMRDGAILRANVYRPEAEGRFPILMTFGPYGKDVPLRQFMQEYMLNVDNEDTRPFREEWIRFTDVAPAAWLARKAIYDPARTPNAATSAQR